MPTDWEIQRNPQRLREMTVEEWLAIPPEVPAALPDDGPDAAPKPSGVPLQPAPAAGSALAAASEEAGD